MISISEKSKLFIAGSPYFIDKTIGEILKSLEGKSIEILRLSSDTSISALEDNLMSPSLFDKHKLIIFRKIEDLKEKGEKKRSSVRFDKVIGQFAANYSCGVIITTNNLKISEEVLKKLPDFEKILEDTSKQNRTQEVLNIFSLMSLTTNKEIAERIGERLEWDFMNIKSTSEKLALYFYGKKPSSSDILAAIAPGVLDPWKFIDPFMAKKKQECIKVLVSLKSADEAIPIFYKLWEYFLAMYIRVVHPELRFFPKQEGSKFFIDKAVNAYFRLWSEENIKYIISVYRDLNFEIVTGASIRGNEFVDTLLKLVILIK